MKNHNTTAVIPARAGSERLPGKNLKLLKGKPLISWTIETALAAACLDNIIVTSDDSITLDIAREYGVHATWRPSRLSNATASTFDAIIDALDQSSGFGVVTDNVMLLQPTSPLRIPEDIDSACDQFCRHDVDSVISVCPCEHPPQWSLPLDDNCSMVEFAENAALVLRSQDLPKYYRLNGAIYVAQLDSFTAHKGFFTENSRAYVMPPERSVDIDTDFDFALCEFLMSRDSPDL